MREMKFKRSSRTSLSKALSAAAGDSSRFARRRTPGGWKLYAGTIVLSIDTRVTRAPLTLDYSAAVFTQARGVT